MSYNLAFWADSESGAGAGAGANVDAEAGPDAQAGAGAEASTDAEASPDGPALTPEDVYVRLNGGETVAGVAPVDRAAVLGSFAQSLPDWAWDGQFLQPPGVAPSDTPAFDVTIGAQLVEFVGYGFEGELGNAIIHAMRPLGLRLYDPQTNERFA